MATSTLCCLFSCSWRTSDLSYSLGENDSKTQLKSENPELLPLLSLRASLNRVRQTRLMTLWGGVSFVFPHLTVRQLYDLRQPTPRTSGGTHVAVYLSVFNGPHFMHVSVFVPQWANLWSVSFCGCSMKLRHGNIPWRLTWNENVHPATELYSNTMCCVFI